MKLGKDVLIEIVAIVQDGLVNSTDVSQKLRDLDLTAVDDQGDLLPEATLSEAYLSTRGRG